MMALAEEMRGKVLQTLQTMPLDSIETAIDQGFELLRSSAPEHIRAEMEQPNELVEAMRAVFTTAFAMGAAWEQRNQHVEAGVLLRKIFEVRDDA